MNRQVADGAAGARRHGVLGDEPDPEARGAAGSDEPGLSALGGKRDRDATGTASGDGDAARAMAALAKRQPAGGAAQQRQPVLCEPQEGARPCRSAQLEADPDLVRRSEAVDLGLSRGGRGQEQQTGEESRATANGAGGHALVIGSRPRPGERLLPRMDS